MPMAGESRNVGRDAETNAVRAKAVPMAELNAGLSVVARLVEALSTTRKFLGASGRLAPV